MLENIRTQRCQMGDEENGLPEELEEPCTTFHNALGETEQCLKLILSSRVEETMESLDHLEQASLLLLNTYTLNSLFWMFLNTQGVSLTDHPIKKELERIQKTMAKVNEVKKKQKRETRKVTGANRFIRNALWSLEEKQKQQKRKSSENDSSSKKSKLDDSTDSP
ncbi:nuclear nucleic acid-binding protein C1D-like [Dysidea avara]|uniref:nuclear nucleic acid-binding protein C1D-like n=1 Tax=Dysidea avara TaxID=196820 RepID=UPI00332C4419